MNAQKALDLINPIPAEEFIEYAFTNGENACCFIGHLQRLTSKDPTDYSIKNCVDNTDNPIRALSKFFIKEAYKIDATIVEVNNYTDVNGYNEPVIKDRLVHCLTDMILAGY